MDLFLLSDISTWCLCNQEHFSVYAAASPLVLPSPGFPGEENPSRQAKRGRSRSGRLGQQEPKAVIDTIEHTSHSVQAQPEVTSWSLCPLSIHRVPRQLSLQHIPKASSNYYSSHLLKREEN